MGSYLSLIPGGSDAGQVDGLVLARVELHHHGVGVDHLHHLGRRRERRDRDYSRMAGKSGIDDERFHIWWGRVSRRTGGEMESEGPGKR